MQWVNGDSLLTKPPAVALEPTFLIRQVVEVKTLYFGPAFTFECRHEFRATVGARGQILAVNKIGPDDEAGLPKSLTPDKPACPVGAGGGFFYKQNSTEARLELQRKQQFAARAQGVDPRLTRMRGTGVYVDDVGGRQCAGGTGPCLHLYLGPGYEVFFGAPCQHGIDLKCEDVAIRAGQFREYGRIIACPCPDLKDVLSLLNS